MKLFTKLCAVVVLATAAIVPVQGQFKFGVKAGVAINSLKLSGEAFDADNRAGFTGGVMAEFTMPLVGVGCDLSVLYASRSVNFINDVNGADELVKKNRSYLDIPLNLKYKLGLPGIGKIVTPFITTGPDFSILMSKKNFEGLRNRKYDFAWNVGAGVQFINHVQIAANYGIGLTKSASGDKSLYSGKNRCWTVTAAYLF